MDSLTPSDLFSPSKARAQRALTQDWAQIDSWLSYKYAGRTVPTFERNEETLKVLRELSTANERADEERAITERLEREALKELDEIEQNSEDEALKRTLISKLTPAGQASLASLTSTAIALSAPDPSPITLAHTLIHHTSTAQTLTNHLTHIQNLQSYLEKQHTLLRDQLAALQTDPAFATPPNLHRQTTEQVRQTKHLKSKIRECEDKLSSLQSGQSRSAKKDADVSSAEAIVEMLERQRGLEEVGATVEALEKRVDEFAGLPADRDAARREVGRLEVELDGLRRRRERLFEEMMGT